ncbi:GntR family transcriptional regulator / MocR family aminotransferase [Bosea sp. OK403]|uniref:MocR-like pyridoxine biosynthesis transcription factor PdxR n=1 Tax=Bosea sp. OK403 TaxID=1855286 RepID=UPI0008DFE78E|nr:PLP-dependent aminotransferase family protein [Bosea sp. OK403]SFJ69876.1 GntR family transcriptional regulator / MocR family aminotransferase [Bosea sp. OK403]
MSANALAWQALDKAAGDLEGQLYRRIRERILDSTMRAGQGLPSSRTLARTLGVARSTVVQAYERLKADGYLVAQTGSATRVAEVGTAPLPHALQPAPSLSETANEPALSRLFEPGVPDLADFPHASWARYLGARARSLRIHDLGYGDANGVRELQKAILEHVAHTRGVVARPEQVMIVPSTRAAIDLLACILLRPGEANGSVAWMEEPGYPTAQALLRSAGAEMVPVPCDDAGIDVARALGPPPRLIYVTPSHQYPTGVTMSLQRRLALLEVAQASSAIVIEDDYDSEFQYGSRPIAALQGIDRNGIVVYLGTFSKILAPGVRVAYAIVPPRLLREVSAALQLRGAVVPIHVQAALADFIRDGRLRSHIRKMKALYAVRMAASVAALRHHCGDALHISDGSGGLQLAAWFRDPDVDDQALAQILKANGFAMQPMSRFHLGPARPGLVFGISRVAPATVQADVARLAEMMKSSCA